MILKYQLTNFKKKKLQTCKHNVTILESHVTNLTSQIFNISLQSYKHHIVQNHKLTDITLQNYKYKFSDLQKSDHKLRNITLKV